LGYGRSDLEDWQPYLFVTTYQQGFLSLYQRHSATNGHVGESRSTKGEAEERLCHSQPRDLLRRPHVVPVRCSWEHQLDPVLIHVCVFPFLLSLVHTYCIQLGCVPIPSILDPTRDNAHLLKATSSLLTSPHLLCRTCESWEVEFRARVC